MLNETDVEAQADTSQADMAIGQVLFQRWTMLAAPSGGDHGRARGQGGGIAEAVNKLPGSTVAGS